MPGYEIVEGVSFDVLDSPEFESIPQELKDKVYETVKDKVKDFHGIATRAQQQAGTTQRDLNQWQRAQADMPQLLGERYLDIAKAVREQGLSADQIIERINSVPNSAPPPEDPAQTQQQKYEQQIRDLAFQAGRGEISDEEANAGIGALSNAIMGLGGNVGQLHQNIEQARQEGQASLETVKTETQQGFQGLQGQINAGLQLSRQMVAYNEQHPDRQASKILDMMMEKNLNWDAAEQAVYGEADMNAKIDQQIEERFDAMAKEKGYVKQGEGPTSPEGQAEQWGTGPEGFTVFRTQGNQARPEGEGGDERVDVRDMSSFQDAIRQRIAEKAPDLH